MRQTKPRNQGERVTQGFAINPEAAESAEPARKVRTRAQILKGEGRRPPAAVDLAALAHNPFNPREELSDVEETAESLRVRGQVQPVTVVRRGTFLSAHPGQEELLGDAEYVVIDGNRRLAAAHLAGLGELRIDVNDDLATSAADILETALIANVHRVDVPPMDQAKAIQALVEVHGSQGKVAVRLGKTPAWVSQRLALLELTPELQEKVETGELRVEPARRIGRMPKEQQAVEAEVAINAVKTPRQRSPRKDHAQAQPEPTVNAVKTSDNDPSERPPASSTVNGVNADRAGRATSPLTIPDPSPAGIVEVLVSSLASDALHEVAELLVARLPSE
ncbi:ParB/RepB/Spo0J family partition protein [Streptomyces fuscigenes]|uniref:ParB/RepB/Spo0J family partition protein n=1 Tax=Streptomyces fuscigenes TaxID=1528880 RepID=UPI001F3AFE37|nr:ParB/RepB/Spo0J family partition protein [Streptomyces fuscigenes]MCF3960463.1 ParB/RepB/Spo0J family partition protein [Streptomyces fuscigenes]